MNRTTIKVRYSTARSRFEAYFYVQESSGRAYGGEIITAGSNVENVIQKAQSVGIVRRMQVWW